MTTTLDYYNKNSKIFYEQTVNVDIGSLYQPFLRYIHQNSKILDLGCGSGRDALAFKNKGYQVEAIDYSEKLVEQSRKLTGIQVRLESFYELDDQAQYDGIWACASLLHCERNRLGEVVGRILNALKPNGICYMSFKYGKTDRSKDGRSFTDLDEAQAHVLLRSFDHILLLQQWITVDKRIDRSEEWLNIIFQKRAV
ncbi:class I SAM-dependent methyltransferase [Acinetobacter sp. CFCC 10889]|uniref:class I SAM-dependent methyltransferase n=1 Tax=Acinetobacter sp. CFCC 10889 TaxID=1775557 RepID=UPI000DD0B319|nr:class I SAM-dependent methyltransferase [Acinetobacter sp. CFCC 10889]